MVSLYGPELLATSLKVTVRSVIGLNPDCDVCAGFLMSALSETEGA